MNKCGKDIILSYIISVHTCEKVRDELIFDFLAANIRDVTSSLALEHSGVITNET